MVSLSSSLLLLFACSLPLAIRAFSFEEIDGPEEPGSALFCNETYVAFSQNGTGGPPFFVINETLTIWVEGMPRFPVLYYDEEGRPVICTTVPDLTPDPLPFSLALFIIIYITTSLAILGSVALLVTYTLFKKLRTLPGQVIMNLAAAFLAGDILIQIRIAHEHHGTFHTASIALQQALFLARYVWMSLTGIEMCRSLYNGVRLAGDSKYKRWLLLEVYLCIGWGVPAIFLAIMVSVQEKGSEEARKWFGVVGYMTNHVPLGITQLINIGVVIFLSVVFWNAAKRQRRLRSSFKKNNINFVRVFLILLTVLGLVWLVFFALLAWRQLLAINIIYVLFTVPQPLLVSIAFICTKKVYRMYLQLFGCRKGDYDASRTDPRSRTLRSNTVTSMMGDRDLQRGKTVMSMLSDRELNPPAYKRESTLGTIEEGEENTVLENGEKHMDSVVEEEEKKMTAHVINGLYNHTSSVECNGNGNGNIKTEKEETAV